MTFQKIQMQSAKCNLIVNVTKLSTSNFYGKESKFMEHNSIFCYQFMFQSVWNDGSGEKLRYYCVLIEHIVARIIANVILKFTLYNIQ